MNEFLFSFPLSQILNTWELIKIDRIEKLIDLRGLRVLPTGNNCEGLVTACQRLSRIGMLINLTLKEQMLRQIGSCYEEIDEQISLHVGDEIVEQLVEWTKMLPFYAELPVEVHTHLLTQRWAQLVLLSACFYSCSSTTMINDEAVVSTTMVDGNEEVVCKVSLLDSSVNIRLLQKRLSAVMGRTIPLEHVIK
ncbi:hypothetical protein NECAME_14749 [Necator americanus]|uniref:NR LBD domain-containing protein n=1 Tax=Necator americanus TaxID=51031 RepID=W2SNL0_NECAM|nr:hypothetical protein NECAME_14749 [Necator americanus]ETN70451.1 hypothetical protein NECAME_14749 [Necator americanus]